MTGENILLGKRTNKLILKDDVGKGKPATTKLPHEQFAYGRSSHYTESAGDGKSSQVK